MLSPRKSITESIYDQKIDHEIDALIRHLFIVYNLFFIFVAFGVP